MPIGIRSRSVNPRASPLSLAQFKPLRPAPVVVKQMISWNLTIALIKDWWRFSFDLTARLTRKRKSNMKKPFTIALLLLLGLTAHAQRAKPPVARMLEGVVVDTTGGARWMGIVVESAGKRYVVATANNPDNYVKDPQVVGEVGTIGTRVKVTYIGTEPWGSDMLALHATRVVRLGDKAQTLNSADPTTGSAPRNSASVRDAMRKFMDSMRRKDSKTFLTLFSRNRSWRHVNTISGSNPPPEMVQVVTYSKFATDKLYLFTFFHDCTPREDECQVFRDNFKALRWKMWKKVGSDKFARPDSPSAYVKWRMENGAWVVDEIGDPGS